MPEFPLQLHTRSSLAVGGLSLKCFHVLFSFPEDEQLQDVQSRRLALQHLLFTPLFSAVAPEISPWVQSTALPARLGYHDLLQGGTATQGGERRGRTSYSHVSDLKMWK